MADEFLKEEGFTHVEYVQTPIVSVDMLANGDLNVKLKESPADYLKVLDADKPLKVLAGIHTGCMELRANERIRSIGDLQGKRVGISAEGASDHVLFSAMAAYVGLDPRRDIEWVTTPKLPQAELLAAGDIDAFIGGPPNPSQPCMSNAGHVVVNIATDKPWSHKFCCMATFNANFMENNPNATKRALRAILRPPMSYTRNRSARHDGGRSRVLAKLRSHAHRPASSSVQSLAGLRPRGHRTVLRAPAAASRHDQEESERDHRRVYRLAFP